MPLVANCLDWAQHRRRKAAAKRPLRLDLHSFLPSCVIVDTAAHHDNKRARELCAGVQEGETVVFDKAYVDFEPLAGLEARGVWWVTRAKDNMRWRARKTLTKGHENIIKDQLVELTGEKHRGQRLRRIEAWVEIEGRWRVMVFITNNPTWSPRSVCDLCCRHWDIEVFFKQVKQKPQALQLPRPQRQRRALAGVCGAAGLCATALHGPSLGLVAQVVPSGRRGLASRVRTPLSRHGVHPPLRAHAFRVVGTSRSAGSCAILWDSSGAKTTTRPLGATLATGARAFQNMMSWDNSGPFYLQTIIPSAKTRTRPSLQTSLRALPNQSSRSLMLRLWDGCEFIE